MITLGKLLCLAYSGQYSSQYSVAYSGIYFVAYSAISSTTYYFSSASQAGGYLGSWSSQGQQRVFFAQYLRQQAQKHADSNSCFQSNDETFSGLRSIWFATLQVGLYVSWICNTTTEHASYGGIRLRGVSVIRIGDGNKLTDDCRGRLIGSPTTRGDGDRR